MTLNSFQKELYIFLQQCYKINYPPDWNDHLKLNNLLSLLLYEPNMYKYKFIQNNIDNLLSKFILNNSLN